MPRQHVHDFHRAALTVILVVDFESELASLFANRTVENVCAHAQTLRRFEASNLIDNRIKRRQPLDLDHTINGVVGSDHDLPGSLSSAAASGPLARPSESRI